jgi:SAM-dependent MidA family methyltransferase
MASDAKVSEMELAQKEFHNAVDSTSSFLKAIFPYGYKLTKKIKEKRAKKKAIKEAKARKESEFKA